jgi:predicted ATP-dependent protease
MSEIRDEIDWSLTTWEGSRRAQLRHALTLTLRERMEAVEALADVARRSQEMRAQGEFTTASQIAEAAGSAAR